MGAIFTILGSLASLVSLICLILVVIKMFGDEVNGGVGKGVLGIICGLYAFIWGWQNVNTHDNKNVMMAWTAAIIGSILFSIIGGAVGGSMG